MTAMNAYTATMVVDGEFYLAGFAPADETEAEELMVDAYQFLINTGLAWSLQGRVGRQALYMIEQGLCSPAQSA